MRNWIRIFRDSWLIFGITIILFLLVEFFAFIANKAYNPYDSRADLPVYKNFKQRIEFWVEYDITWRNLQYVPYSLWSRPPFSGKWTNIDVNGDRVTHYNADKSLNGVKKIFMFGGSTLWGTGAPDWETIPSYLAKSLNENSSRYIVYNYGETGYVSSQGLNRLISEIKKDNIPDIVIFYSGINDVSVGAGALLALKTPSYHTYMDRFERVFKKNKSVHLFKILETTYIYRAINFFKDRLFPAQEKRWEKTIKEEEMREAVCKTAQYWIGNYKIASSIGKEYGFKVIFILQPNITGKKILQEYEKKFLKGGRTAIKAAYRQIREMIKKNNFSGIYDLSDVFETISQPIYIDRAHIGPLGNYYVTGKIVEFIRGGNY